MPRHHIRLTNTPPPPSTKKADCQLCGMQVRADTLVRQRGILVSTEHRGCLDTEPTFPLNRLRQPARYGMTPDQES